MFIGLCTKVYKIQYIFIERCCQIDMITTEHHASRCDALVKSYFIFIRLETYWNLLIVKNFLFDFGGTLRFETLSSTWQTLAGSIAFWEGAASWVLTGRILLVTHPPHILRRNIYKGVVFQCSRRAEVNLKNEIMTLQSFANSFLPKNLCKKIANSIIDCIHFPFSNHISSEPVRVIFLVVKLILTNIYFMIYESRKGSCWKK